MKRNVRIRKTISFLIVVGLALSLLWIFAQAENTVAIGGVDKLKVTYTWDDGGQGFDSYTVTPGTKTLSVNVKSHYSWFEYYSGTVTLKLTSEYSQARLYFEWSAPKNGTVSVDGSSGTTSGVFDQIINKGDTIVITVTSKKSAGGNTAGITLSLKNISLTENVLTIPTTFIPPKVGGSYSVDGESITSEKTRTEQSSNEYHLVATPAAGYAFVGWRNADTNEFFSDEKDYKALFAKSMRVQPVFVPEADPVFGVGTQRFFDLNDANNYANGQSSDKTIVLLKSGPLAANTTYTISSGVALLIPYSSDFQANYPEPSNSSGNDIKQNRVAFRTLTVPNGTTLSVDGVINVNGQVSKGYSQPTGPYGLITLKSKDSSIVLNNGSSLYCWGYINGEGVVTAKSGAKVYECFQLTGWRGGQAATQFISNKGTKPVFPVNQYYIQNVEAELEFNSGAKEYVYASVVVNDEQMKITAEFISDQNANAGMFRLGPDCTLTKKYIHENDRMRFNVNGPLYIGTMTLSFPSATLDSKDYPLPINNNFTINICSGSTTISKDQSIALLPGAELNISRGANVEVASDPEKSSKMYVYDLAENWKGKNYAYNAELRVVGYSTYNGTKVMRTVNDLTDATIDVNGNLIVSGKLFTTSGGANIVSTQGDGKILFKQASSAKDTTYQATQHTIIGGKVIIVDFHEVPCTSAKLRNANDKDGNEQFTLTAGAKAGWTYTYLTKALSANPTEYKDMWYLFKVTYIINGQTKVKYITTDSDSFNVPGADASSILKAETKKGTATCSFEGSTLNVSGINAGEDRECTIWITNTKQEFTIKFDGNEPESGKLSGSTNSMTVPMSETTVTLPDCGFTATGWKFVGWSLKKDTAASSTELLKTSATQGQLGNPAAGDEVILYAIWQPDKVYSVTVSWSKGLEYTYIPNEYTWNATEMRYEHTRGAVWIGANDSNPTVTISNGGDKTDVIYGHINVGIQYTPKAAAYNGFTMDFLVDNKSMGKGSVTLATKLAPKNSVTTTMKLEGTPFIGMDTGNPITIGTVALTLTTAD